MGSISVKKYCIVEKGLNEQHAGSKARNDVADTLIKERMESSARQPSGRKGECKLCRADPDGIGSDERLEEGYKNS